MFLTAESPVQYQGEPIDIHSVLHDIDALAIDTRWQRDLISVSDSHLPKRVSIPAYRRTSRFPHRRIYLSTGIHGDEPAGPVAILELMKENRWPDDAEIWICPCLNLSGFVYNRRENEGGIDLNRDYRKLETEEVRTHVSWLKRKPNFDVTLCLHEDHAARGFYLYESNPDDLPSLARKIVCRVAEACPIDRSGEINGWPSENGIVRTVGNFYEKAEWTEGIFLLAHKTRLSYTLETPSNLSLETRANAFAKAVRAVLDCAPGAY
jgi:hypothetical protein